MKNMEIYNAVREVPQEAQKTINAGRLKGFTDINPMWRIKVLTEQFGACGIGWYYEITKQWIDTVGEEKLCFVEIALYIKVDGEWSKPIHGIGGNKIATKERSGVYASDEGYKMATTDAISYACKNLGIGADVYFEHDQSKYDTAQQQMQFQHQPAQQAEQTIGETDIQVLRTFFASNKLSEAKILRAYKRKRIEELTQKNAASILKTENLPYFQQNCAEG